MANFFDSFSKVSLNGQIQKDKIINSFGSMPRLDETESVKTTSFKDTMNSISDALNKDMNAPDELMRKVMNGEDGVDIHDVMTAMAKAELSVSVATQISSKVIQSYEKIMQISV